MNTDISTTVVAFIDASNINLAVKANNWNIDYVRLSKYIDSYGKCPGKYYFTPKPSYKNIPALDHYLRFRRKLISNGYIVKDKEIKETISINQNGIRTVTSKGNMDVEMAHWMLKTHKYYDTALIMSGDADFASVIESLMLEGKYIVTISDKDSTSLESKNISHKFIDLNSLKSVLEIG